MSLVVPAIKEITCKWSGQGCIISLVVPAIKEMKMQPPPATVNPARPARSGPEPAVLDHRTNITNQYHIV